MGESAGKEIILLLSKCARCEILGHCKSLQPVEIGLGLKFSRFHKHRCLWSVSKTFISALAFIEVFELGFGLDFRLVFGHHISTPTSTSPSTSASLFTLPPN